MEHLKQALEQLGRQVADEQDELLRSDTADLESARRRLLVSETRVRSRRRVGPKLIAVGLAASVAAAAAAGTVLWMRQPKPLAFTVASGATRGPGSPGAWLSAARGEPVKIDFSDGTQVTLGARSRARVVDVSSAGAAVVLESGHAELSVVPRPNSKWHVNLGPFTVQVTGTQFAVDWDPETEVLMLDMHEGRVVVSGCMFDEGRPVTAGETLRAACREQRVEIRSRASTEEELAAPAPVDAAADPATLLDSAELEALTELEQVAPPPPVRAPEAAPSWRALVKQGRYKDAYAAAAHAGFEQECERASAADLLSLADAARFAGHVAQAERAYDTLRRRFPSDERASVAAFTLARIAFDGKRSYSDAARWFRTYLRERPGGALAREALGRLMESLQNAGDRAGAERTAQEYLKRYPSGPHSDLAERIVGR